MSVVTVIRPKEVEVYECDGFGCTAACDSRSWPNFECSWIKFVDPEFPKGNHWKEYGGDDPDAVRFFCSWRCLAYWARARMIRDEAQAA